MERRWGMRREQTQERCGQSKVRNMQVGMEREEGAGR